MFTVEMLAGSSVTFHQLRNWDQVLAGEISEVWSSQTCWSREVIEQIRGTAWLDSFGLTARARKAMEQDLKPSDGKEDGWVFLLATVVLRNICVFLRWKPETVKRRRQGGDEEPRATRRWCG